MWKQQVDSQTITAMQQTCMDCEKWYALPKVAIDFAQMQWDSERNPRIVEGKEPTLKCPHCGATDEMVIPVLKYDGINLARSECTMQCVHTDGVTRKVDATPTDDTKAVQKILNARRSKYRKGDWRRDKFKAEAWVARRLLKDFTPRHLKVTLRAGTIVLAQMQSHGYVDITFAETTFDAHNIGTSAEASRLIDISGLPTPA